MIPLPEWVDAELWDEYVAQRKQDRKAMSPRSARDRLARLFELRSAGYDVNKSIAEAINGHWLDFYPPQDKSIQRVSVPDELARYRQERPQTAEDRAKVEEIRARINGAVKRVA